jgi:hypothetical protein
MARFKKEEMLQELRTIFLFEADHILMGAGPEKAEHFIGFDCGDEGEYCHLSPEKVDLSRFGITGAFERGYEYAFQPSVMNTLGEDEVQDLNTFMYGTPRAGGISSGGETHVFMTPDGLCQRVADTVFARWKLEWDSVGAGSHAFTTRELALLADMTEGAVRNALADKSENGLRAVVGSKNPVVVEHAEAQRWLRGRRGFIPYPEHASTDRFLTEHLQNIQSSEALGRLIAQRLREASVTTVNEQMVSGWSEADINQWIAGSQAFNEQKARGLAEALGLEVPLFAGKALEVILRRDMSQNNGGK